MLFSFASHEPSDTGDWPEIDACLPDGYVIPDPRFLQSMQPDLPSTLARDRSWLNPAGWNGDEPFWASVAKQLPPSYSIPDTALLERILKATCR